jgi:hypothetical protein
MTVVLYCCRLLNESSLQEWDIHMLPEYTDPYHKRLVILECVQIVLN